MILKYLFFILSFTLFFSCKENSSKVNSEKSKELLINKIKSYENALNKGFSVQASKDSLKMFLQKFVHFFPSEENTAVCLDKLQMIYSGENEYLTAAKYVDTLIKEYPKYSNRALIIESQIANYDIFIKPRDTSKVRFYYELLLNENPDMDSVKKQDIQNRLAKLELSYNEFRQLKDWH